MVNDPVNQKTPEYGDRQACFFYATVNTTRMIVAMISPIPEIRAGISVLCIMGFRIIAFRYCRSFVALSCQAPTTILCLEKVSHTGKRIKHFIAPHHEGQYRHKKLSFAERSKSSFYLSSTLSVSANHFHRHSVGD